MNALHARKSAALLLTAALTLSTKASARAATVHISAGDEDWYLSVPNAKLAKGLETSGRAAGADLPDVKRGPECDFRFELTVEEVMATQGLNQTKPLNLPGFELKSSQPKNIQGHKGYECRLYNGETGEEVLDRAVQAGTNFVSFTITMTPKGASAARAACAEPLELFNKIAATLSPGHPSKSKEGAAAPESSSPTEPAGPSRKGHKGASRAARAPSAPHAVLSGLQAGVDYLKKGLLDTSRSKLERALAEQPADPDTHVAYAIFERVSGETAEFRNQAGQARGLDAKSDRRFRTLLAARKAKGKDPYALLGEGLSCEAQEDAECALKRYNAAVSAGRKLWLPYAVRGALRSDNRECTEAQSDLDRAATLNPEFKTLSGALMDKCKYR